MRLLKVESLPRNEPFRATWLFGLLNMGVVLFCSQAKFSHAVVF